MSDIDFIDYDKISIQSDAFITSAELNCYFQYLPSTKAISYNIKKELHTAGTTEDPNDYKIPDVSSKILPRKLYRINPFHSNYSENLELNKINCDPNIIYPTKAKDVKEKVIDYSSFGLNSDQIEFMMALQNLKSLKSDESITKLNIEQFESVDEKVMNGFFQLYPRFMEMLTSGASSGGFNQFFDDTESESMNENEALVNEAIKKMGLNPSEVRVKKKFEVRPGNAKKDEVNAYLQDISLSNDTANNTKSINNNSVTNINQINLQNNNKIDLQVKSSKTVNNIRTANNTDFNFINNTNRTINQQITNLNKFSEATKVDFENLYKAFLKDLNIAPNVENQFFKIVNQHSKNLSIEFNRILNHSEKTVYETNLKNLSTSYNFYRHIENRYREFIQNLNFFNDTVQQIRQTEVNLKNTYQNIHRHSVTLKNNHYKNILNLTKNVNYEYTANDYEFQYAVLKTIKNSNQYVENKITKIKNDLNVAQQNISFVHHRMVHIQEKTSNFVAKEVKNVLNSTDYNEYSKFYLVEKLSNFNTENITEKINLLKSINVTQDVKKTENIVRKIQRLARYNNIDQITQNIDEISNIQNNVNISELKTEVQNLKNIKVSQLNFLSENIEKLSKINQINNLTQEQINTVKQISQVNKNDISNLKISNINQQIEVIQKISNIESKDLLNIVNLTKTVQERKIYNRISNLVKNVEILDTVNVTQETAQNISKISNTNNINQITKDLNLISQNYREFKTSVQQINKISQVKNVDQIVKNLNYVSNIIQENNIVNRTSKIDQKDFITAINLSKNYIQSFNRFESKISNISQRQKIRETLQDINIVNNEVNNSNVNITNKTQKVQLQEFIQNLNLLETEKNTTILNRYSFESNKKNISHLFTELNVTQQMKQEKKNDREFARISKRLDRINRETIKVQGNSYKVEQNFFDMMNFYNEQKVTKTSKDRKVNNFFQLLDVLNVQKTTNERKVTQKIQKVEQTQNRIINNTSQIKIDVYKDKKDNYYKVDNRQTFTTNNYHQEKEEQKKTEKIVENKVEELLVKKIENVTNNLVSNVITKNEFHTIKKEIIQEIYNIEMKTEERIKDLRKETQQTVQTMLERFLRS
jgi:hypothetical protein